MPLYEYECFVCNYRFERIQRVNDQQVSDCPSCGGAVRRLLGVPALQFKGSGWYVTDYGTGKGNSQNEKSEPAAEAGASDPKKSDTKGTETPSPKDGSKGEAKTP